MISSKQLGAVGQMPFGRFVTTYMRDYNPFSQHHLMVNQRRPITDVTAAPPFAISPQTGCDIWPIFYKTTNSVYGSASNLQPPSYSPSPESLPRFGILAPPIFEASEAVGSTLTEARTQDTGVARETWPAVCEEEKGQLHYVFDGKVLEQRESRDEPQHKFDVLYEEGVIVLSSLVCPACCQSHIRSACREAGLQALLHLPVTPSPTIQIKDAGKWDNIGSLKDLVACGSKNSTFLQPFPKQYSCCVCKTELPYSCSFKMQTFTPGIPCGSTLHVAQNVNCREQSRKPRLTEYQASYTAKWTQSQIQNPYLPNPKSIFYSI